MLEETERRRELRALLVGLGVDKSPTSPLQVTGSALCLGGMGLFETALSPEKAYEQDASTARGAVGAGRDPAIRQTSAPCFARCREHREARLKSHRTLCGVYA